MAKRLIPLFDRILVEKVGAPAKTVGGILLPETAASKVQEATVVAAGPGRHQNGQLVPTTVKEGDKVLLPDYGGQMVTLDEKELYLYTEGELMGILQG